MAKPRKPDYPNGLLCVAVKHALNGIAFIERCNSIVSGDRETVGNRTGRPLTLAMQTDKRRFSRVLVMGMPSVPYRRVAAAKLGEFLNVIAHPRRIHIIEELRSGERDVGSLQTALGTSHSNVSQHLALLRAHRVVSERREGRYVFYRLCTPELAAWLLDGTQFLPEMVQEVEQVKSAVESARQAWSPGRSKALDASTAVSEPEP